MQTGGGQSIAFWYDLWLDCGQLMIVFPTLFTFDVAQFCTVASQFRDGQWNIQLHPNLSYTATQELAALAEILSYVLPQVNTVDTRMPLLVGKSLSTPYFYKLFTFRGKLYMPAKLIWDRIIPHKYRIFLLIALRDRHNTRDNMMMKHWDKIASHNGCDLCLAVETMSHILLRCKLAQALWSNLG